MHQSDTRCWIDLGVCLVDGLGCHIRPNPSLPDNEFTISPLTRKRKAAEALSSSLTDSLPPSKRIASALSPPDTTTSMADSDEYMSGLSSEDDILQDESENESGDDGKQLPLNIH